LPRILDRIDSPADLKRLRLSELQQLASEIRSELLNTVMANGGHLASNLGVVELTIALHSVLDSPRDKIVWDVGHQSYVHKLLTGRRERFSTIRQYGGLSGYPDPSESPHDAFGTGHASTSISAALGMAVARDLAGEDYQVVAVIGDGAMTGGMAFEALNQAGNLTKRLTVVLNDNAMAISPSVGALARYFNRVRLDHRYYRAKEGAEQIITRVPFLGKQLWRAVKRVKKSFKGLLVPTMLWEELGFVYLGPVDGHNIAEIQAALRRARDYSDRPVLVHVLTKKGKGYEPAEDDAVGFHGVPPNGGEKNKAPSYSQVFGRTCLKIARDNPNVVAITAAMPEGTGLNIMARELPDRVFDVGICEQHAVTFAAGLASRGYVPIVAIYSTFLQRAFDQIVHDVCTQNLPVVFALDRSGIVGDDGKTHQGTLDLSYLTCIPNMTVASPKDENELQHLLYTAVNCHLPMAIRYPRGNGVGVPLDAELRQLPIGKGEIVMPCTTAPDIAILAIGTTVLPALEAAQRLKETGIAVMVVNARFAKPLDSSLILDTARKAERLVTVEENALAGGFGSAVLALLESCSVKDVEVARIGLPDEFVEHGPQALLRARYSLDGKGIADRILSAFPHLALSASSLAGSKERRA